MGVCFFISANFFIFFPKITNIFLQKFIFFKEKTKNAASQLASKTDTRWTGNISFFLGGPIIKCACYLSPEESAEQEPAWQGVGADEGLKIWRIEVRASCIGIL